MLRTSIAYMSASLWMLSVWTGAAKAQSAMDAWASWALAPKVWKGQMVAWPDGASRPDGLTHLSSERLPVHAHGALGEPRRLRAALSALEQAYTVASEQGWPLPFADGGAGGTAGFDLYLLPAARAAAYAEVDGPVMWSDFDAAQTYAVVDAGLSDRELAACALSALVQAGLRGQDPSEAESWVRATGDFAAWSDLGELGCAGALAAAQAHADMPPLHHEPGDAAGGGLWLAALSERHDGGSGAFIRALWELTRQRSAGLVPAGVLRSSPDLWEVLGLAVKEASESVNDLLEDFAVARYFAGHRSAPYKVLRALPASVGLLRDVQYAELPEHIRSGPEGLAPLGSAYVRVAVDAAASSELRVWLRGELGPHWSLLAVRLAADGGELGRMAAPRRDVPSGYLPVLLTADTTHVVLVVTHLLEKTPDADRPAPPPHGFELIIDRLAR